MGTTVGTHLVSLRYTEDIDNGHVLAIGSYEDNSREVREASVPAAATARGLLALCASEEIIKDVASHDIFEFYNKAGKIIRGYRFAVNDIFSVSRECLASDSLEPAVGQFAVVSGSTRIRLAATATGTTIGRVIEVEIESSGNEFVVIEVT